MSPCVSLRIWISIVPLELGVVTSRLHLYDLAAVEVLVDVEAESFVPGGDDNIVLVDLDLVDAETRTERLEAGSAA